MKDTMSNVVHGWLEKGKVKAILGLTEARGTVRPYLFKQGDTAPLVVSPKYPLASILMRLQERYPEESIGVIARECDIRALVELCKRGKIDLDKISIIGIACSEEEAEECACEHPYPHMGEEIVGKEMHGVEKNPSAEKIAGMKRAERLDFWKLQFNKCIKCYGCRDACSLCICSNCTLGEDMWVRSGTLPPPFPIFHLIRAGHTAGRCVGCGECEKACPMDIPLTSLYALLRKDISDLFDYTAGLELEKEIPLLTNLEEMPMKEEG